MPEDDATGTKRQRPRAARIVLALLVCLAVPIVPFVLIGELPGERWLSSQDDHALAFALLGSALLLADIALPVPSSLIGTALGARLGFLPGFLSSWLALSLGHCLGYLAGRLAIGSELRDVPAAPTLLAVFLSRPVPVLAEAIAIAAGASSARFGSYLASLVAGNAIYAAALAATGAALLPGGLLGPALILPMAVPGIGWLIWRWRARSKSC